MGINDEYGCFVDDEDGAACVMDRGKTDDGIVWSHKDCILAANLHAEGKSKGHCKYWRSKTGDQWNDGLAFAIHRTESMIDEFTESGQVQKANGLFQLVDALEVYLD